ncbi:apoptosis-inducing factor 3 isoform X2 [Cephus cinctus]|uniref:Apoptosis-inducing factor 3 isoform X2 n=1 Tax=Cephus cinctus TaxID=211228 RepID=A0AAJ7RFD2_CEPCN|nr:apoptosis-inducing factor 3 isoform X2 [Cephus cinctus]
MSASQDNDKDRIKLSCKKCNEESELYEKFNIANCCCSCISERADYVEGVVCNEKDINENEMKMLPLGDDGGKILLIKQKGELHAIGTKCTHYGALMHTGALGEGRVRCPWHGACFNIKTGDIEDYPGLDSLPCYQVTVNNKGLVNVRARRKDLELNKRTKTMCKFDAANKKMAVIIGGGPSGATCAETLRQEGFTGRIVMVCKEPILPYDRCKVSKTMDFELEKALLRPQLFYDENKIETKLNVEATALDTNANIVKLSSNEELKYDYLYIATGSKARKPDVPGADLANIFVMRNHADSVGIVSQLSLEKHVVVLGLSFIGMEAAAYCIGKVASVTVVGRDTVPFRAVFGPEIGERAKREHELKGVKFIFGTNIAKFIPNEDDTAVKEIELLNGTVLPADIAIMGIGSTFFTEWLKDSSLEMKEDGSIVTDQYLKTNIENVYAGGDIVYAPVYSSNNERAAIGHYPLAHYHGKIAAQNICGKLTPLKAVPFFWTTLFGKSYRYAGYGKADKIKIHGSLDDLKFFTYYFKDGKVIAMSSVGRDPIVADFANLLYEGRALTEEEVEKDPVAWMRHKPKDFIKKDTSSEKSNAPVPDIKSDKGYFGNQQGRSYHTLALVRPLVYDIRQTRTKIFNYRNCLKYLRYFHITRML